MKTADEIRRHRDDLRRAQRTKCECAGTAHERDCVEGALMMVAAERVLSWVLGEDSKYQRMVEEIRLGVRTMGQVPGVN